MFPLSFVAPVASTSTMAPGVTNPATATTSFTATDSARIPSGIVAANPPPAAMGANFDSRMGSFWATEVIKARFWQSSIRENIFATGAFVGQGISPQRLRCEDGPERERPGSDHDLLHITMGAGVEAIRNSW